jgi:hypothetical protein
MRELTDLELDSVGGGHHHHHHHGSLTGGSTSGFGSGGPGVIIFSHNIFNIIVNIASTVGNEVAGTQNNLLGILGILA